MAAREVHEALFGAPIDPDWRLFAGCQEVGTDLFFPEEGEKEHAAGVKAICRSCAAQPECLATAIATGEVYGIWGGFTPRERQRLVREMRAEGLVVPRWERRPRRTA
jgi:WhiB family transcriptional regulator, redox-sensing transcriptional regulator